MTWLDKVERRLGFLAIPGLAKILVAFTGLVFALAYLTPDFIPALDLDPARIRHGEVWRLFTYIFIPSTLSPWWILFALWFLWWVGEGLERAMGPFRFTLYFLLGMVGTAIAAFFFGSRFSNGMLMASLFFAFARFYADEVIYILFILPMKIKWVAWVLAAFLLIQFFVGPMSYRMALVAAFINYFLFFGGDIIHDARHRRDVTSRRKRFEDDTRAGTVEALHHCKTCGATELTDPNLEFRVARDGEEYCVPHLPKAPSASAA
jgi:membrane associated rhomboid family serine protease